MNRILCYTFVEGNEVIFSLLETLHQFLWLTGLGSFAGKSDNGFARLGVFLSNWATFYLIVWGNLFWMGCNNLGYFL